MSKPLPGVQGHMHAFVGSIVLGHSPDADRDAGRLVRRCRGRTATERRFRSPSARASFGFGPDAIERRADCCLPLGSNLVSPPAAQPPEVRTELAGVLQSSRALFRMEREPLDHMRN